MTVILPASGYMSDSTRIKGEMKSSFEELRDAIEVVDTNADANTSNMTALTGAVNGVVSGLSTHANDSVIHVTSAEKAKLIYVPTYVATQQEFDALFDGTTLENLNIYLVYTGTSYELKNNIPIGSNLKIDSDPGVIVVRKGQYRFHSTGTFGSNVKYVHFTDKWSFDGARATYTYSGSGGFANISYTEECKFETYVFDCLVAGDGGAYYATTATTINNVIRNIKNCEAVNGGACYNCDYSIISNISNCQTTVGAANVGIVYSCNNSIISNISYSSPRSSVSNCDNCTITNIHHSQRYGCYECDNCTITDIYNNGEEGVLLCENCDISNVHNNGKIGVSSCNYCTITNIHHNITMGVYNCNYCTITNIHHNTTNGVSTSNKCTITNIHNNSKSGVISCDESMISDVQNNIESGTLAGGAVTCDNSVFFGPFRGNTSTGSYNHISNSVNCIAFVIGDGTSSLLISSSRATINF